MPYLILHKSPRCWAVINKETGRVHAKCTTETKAKAQMRLLYGIESGKLVPRKKNISVDNKKKMNPWIVHVKKVAVEKGISYREALKIASKSYKKKSSMKGKGMDPMTDDEEMDGGRLVVHEIGFVPPPKGKKCVKGSKFTHGKTTICKYEPEIRMKGKK